MIRSLAARLACLTLLCGAATAADPFAVTTPGKPGGGGLVPELSGFGTGLASSANALHLSQAAGNAGVTLVIGLSEAGLPFKGGVLGPAPDLLVAGLLTDGSGTLSLPFTLHAELPLGLTTWIQLWILDPAAGGGLSASNTLAFSVQAAPAPYFDAASVITTVTTDPASELAAGDFNEDGVPDLAVLLGFNEGVSVFVGAGDGTFAGPVPGGAQSPGAEFTVADLDGDGHLDVTVAGFHSDVVTAWFGGGDGSFGGADAYATADIPVHVIATDMDGDGALDLVSANASGSISVLINRGGGTFHEAVSHTVGFNPVHVAAGDLDLDGERDLAVSFGADFGRVALLFGQGRGVFAEPEVLVTGANPQQLLIEDLDGNGFADLAVCHTSSNDVVVFLGTGGGNLGTPTSYFIITGTQPEKLACADLDGDGFLDLVTSHFTGLSILRGTGNGAFFPHELLDFPGSQKHGLAVADFNGDGAVDLATTALQLNEILVVPAP